MRKVITFKIIHTMKVQLYLIRIGFLSLLSCLVACQQNAPSENSSSMISNSFIGESKYFEGGYSVLNHKGKLFFMDKKGISPENLAYTSILEKVGAGISSMDHFHEGFSVIMKKESNQLLWGYINKNGENEFDHWYQFAGEFNKGFAPIKDNEKWGSIDRKGKIVIPVQFDGVSEIINDKAWIKEGDTWSYYKIPELKKISD